MPKASYSSLSTFRDCRRKFAYRYVDKLAKDSDAGPPLLIGSWFHGLLAVDALRRGIEAESLLHVEDDIDLMDGSRVSIDPKLRTLTFRGDLLPLEGESIVRIASVWWASLESERRDDVTETLGAPIPDRLDDLFRRYRDRWSAELETEEPLLVEVWWSRTVPGTEVRLSGRGDQVYRDRRRGIVVVRDHKLVGRWPSEPDAVLDIMDSQLHLYAWGMASVLEERATKAGVPVPKVSAVEYDRLRYKRPATPRLTQKGNLSKSVTDFDLPTYIEFTESEGIEADESVVASLAADRDRFFRRRLTPVNRNIVREHLRAAVSDATEAEKITDSDSAPRTPTKGCAWCDYLQLCRAQLVGSVQDDYDPAAFGLRRK